MIAAGVAVLRKLGYGLTYSATISMPQGLYLVVPAKRLQRNDIVVFVTPAASHTFLLQHNWGPRSGRVLKYVMGIPGDFVCNYHNKNIGAGEVWVNTHKIGPIYNFYAPGKLLPQNNFCEKLQAEQYFLLSTKIERSFDSRYFGPVDRNNILGRAVLLKN